MKILYAIQGTGNGHISRSKEIIKRLSKITPVDVLISETQHEISIGFDVKYKLTGLGFVFGKKGGIDYVNTLKHARPNKFLSDVYALPVENYDIVISDFEPITAWACKLKKKPHISLSHQASFLSDKMPRPDKVNNMVELIIKWYAPVSIPIGLHFQKYDDFILTPVIREEIRKAKVKNLGHYTVYLPSFDEKYIINYLKNIDVRWELFSKHYKGQPYVDRNVTIYPISNEWFIQSFSTCEGIFCNSGFETPSEALYLGKKILAIPMKGQYEQECNAAALKMMGISTLYNINEESIKAVTDWINSSYVYNAEYNDNSSHIVEMIMDFYFNDHNDYFSDCTPRNTFREYLHSYT